MKKIALLTIVSLGFISRIALSEEISVPYITNVEVMTTKDGGCPLSQYQSAHCVKVTYSSYKANLSILEQQAPRPSTSPQFGIYSRKVVGRTTYIGAGTVEPPIRIASGDTWKSLINKYNKQLPSSGTIIASLRFDGNNDWQGSCVAFGAFGGSREGIVDVMLPTSNTCIPVPRPNVACSFDINDINFSFGTLNTNSIDGTRQNKSFVVNCTEDTDVQYSLVNADTSGLVGMSSDTSPSMVYSRLFLDGTSISDGTFKSSEKEGDNPHQIMAEIESSNGAGAGHYTGSAVLIISPE